jgi:NAD-dependent DNA ligase
MKYRQPLIIDSKGLYITAAQLTFYLNDKINAKDYESGSANFISYYNNCKVYNYIFDKMIEDSDCAQMYWDPKKESVAISFPVGGQLSESLKNIYPHLTDMANLGNVVEADEMEDFIDEDEDDPYNLF